MALTFPEDRWKSSHDSSAPGQKNIGPPVGMTVLLMRVVLQVGLGSAGGDAPGGRALRGLPLAAQEPVS